MGAYNGAEVCELIGIYMLYLIVKKQDSKNIGLCRDDGLAIFKNASGPTPEKIKNTTSFVQVKRPANNYRVQLDSRKLS